MPTDPFKVKIINITRSKFSLPGGIMKVDVDGWILKSVSQKWKDYKYDLKAKSKINQHTQQEVSKSVPPEVVPQQWIDLVRYWYSEKSEKYSKIGTASRKNHTTPHTTGSKSFARKRDEFEEKNKKQPGRIEFYAITHNSKDKAYINTASNNFVENAMNAIAASSAAEPSKSSTNLENDYIKNTLKRDKYGRVLGYGNGHTPTTIFGLQSQLRDMDNEQEDPMKEEVKRLKAKIEVMQNKHDSDMLEIKSLLRQLVGQSVNSSTDIRDLAPS
uniref:Transposase Tnp1/En/Spm-like domain-containing protein n=1 Tax=Ananas comosus var. bracteatus TaxID=296719 RepID=A0A6V7PSD5_ANACO|nr:unnamed protein product [Ananas comosus var. bracteatus]